jgi:hypothetical protein
MAREGIEPPTRGFSVPERAKHPTSPDHAGVVDAALGRQGVVFCSPQLSGLRSQVRTQVPRPTPPPMLHGRRLCKRLVLAAGSHIGQNVRVRGASRTRTTPRGASRKIYKYRRTEHRGLGLATQQAPRNARSPSPPGRAPRLGRNRPLPGPRSRAGGHGRQRRREARGRTRTKSVADPGASTPDVEARGPNSDGQLRPCS